MHHLPQTFIGKWEWHLAEEKSVMIFDSLDQVVDRWKIRFEQMDLYFNNLPIPGYSDVQIESLEKTLEIQFHPTFRSVLKKVGLNSVSFRGASFGSGMEYSDYLIEMNTGDYHKRLKNTEILNIGGGGRYLLLLKNNTGRIYAYEMDKPEQLILIADDIICFICISATIADQIWPKFKNKQEALDVADMNLNEMEIKLGRQFWGDLIRNAL